MPTRDKSGFPSPDHGPDKHIVPFGVNGSDSNPMDIVDDDALWLLLNTYADGECTPDEIVQVESLIRANPSVAREFSFLELTSTSVREFTVVEPPISMTNAIFAATRRTSLRKRVAAWWTQATAGFGPAPVRIGAAVLASGVLALVIWSRSNVGHTIVRRPGTSPVAMGSSHNTNTVKPTLQPLTTHEEMARATSPIVPVGPRRQPSSTTGQDHFVIPTLHELAPVVAKEILPKPNAAARIKRDTNLAKATVVRPDAPTPGIKFARVSPEERHMPSASDFGKASGTDDLGPDIYARPATADMDAPTTVASATYDEPPTGTTVSTVSYKPGSISAKTMNAPPSVQSLYMRTQEAIRRQHELQQYGGYGREAFNNIQRGEVGFSLVGGRF